MQDIAQENISNSRDHANRSAPLITYFGIGRVQTNSVTKMEFLAPENRKANFSSSIFSSSLSKSSLKFIVWKFQCLKLSFQICPKMYNCIITIEPDILLRNCKQMKSLKLSAFYALGSCIHRGIHERK